MKFVSFFLSLLIVAPAMAQRARQAEELPKFEKRYSVEKRIEAADFGATDINSLAPNAVDFKFKFIPFKKWNAVEKKVLSPYEEYKEPFIPQLVNDKVVPVEVPLQMYVARAVFIVNKPANQIQLSKFISDVKMIKSLSPFLREKPIFPADVITYNEPGMEFRNPPLPRRWCDEGHRTLCFETRVNFDNTAIDIAYAQVASEREQELEGKTTKKMYKSLFGQSELRVDSASDIKNPQVYKQLTGVTTEPAGVLD